MILCSALLKSEVNPRLFGRHQQYYTFLWGALLQRVVEGHEAHSKSDMLGSSKILRHDENAFLTLRQHINGLLSQRLVVTYINVLWNFSRST